MLLICVYTYIYIYIIPITHEILKIDCMASFSAKKPLTNMIPIPCLTQGKRWHRLCGMGYGVSEG